MANRERGQTTFEANGETYVLQLTTNAMCELEALLSTPERDVSFKDVLRRVQQGSQRAIRAFFWASLRQHHPKLTIDDVGRLLDSQADSLSTQLQVLMQSAEPDPHDLKDLGVTERDSRPLEAQDVAAGTGETSSSRPGVSA